MREALQYTVQYVGDFSRIRQEAQKLTEQSNRGTAGVTAVADAALGKARALKQEILGAGVALNRMYSSWQRLQREQAAANFVSSTTRANSQSQLSSNSGSKYANAISPDVADRRRQRNWDQNGSPATWSGVSLVLGLVPWGKILSFLGLLPKVAGAITSTGLTAARTYAGVGVNQGLNLLSLKELFTSGVNYTKERIEIDFLANYGQYQAEVQKAYGLTDQETRSLWMGDVAKGQDRLSDINLLYKSTQAREYQKDLYARSVLRKKIAYNESVGRWEMGRMYPSLQQPEEAAAFDSLPQIYDRYEEYYRGINNLATESAEQATKTQAWSADEIYKVLVTSYDAAKQKSSEVGQHQTQQILLASNSAVQAYQILGQAQAQVSTKMVEDWDQAALDIEDGFAELGDMQVDLAEDVSQQQIDAAQATQKEMIDLAKAGVRERQAIEQGFIATWTQAWDRGYDALNDMIYGFMMGQKDVWSNFAQSLKSIFFSALSGSITDVIKSWTSSLFSGLADCGKV